MTEQHTPGPWKLDFFHRFVEGRQTGTGHIHVVATVHEIGDGLLEGDVDANARLIAQAPDLLKERDELRAVNTALLMALEEIAKGEGRYSQNRLIHCENAVEDMMAIARAAIAKAKGGG